MCENLVLYLLASDMAQWHWRVESELLHRILIEFIIGRNMAMSYDLIYIDAVQL